MADDSCMRVSAMPDLDSDAIVGVQKIINALDSIRLTSGVVPSFGIQNKSHVLIRIGII
jgi:hypothetical protein